MRGGLEVTNRLKQLDQMGFTLISMGELLTGFRQGPQQTQKREQFTHFLEAPGLRLLAVDEATTHFYAATVVALEPARTPIPTSDLCIAALAQRQGLPLIP
jgi:tRNA(fMet)-specific endonuclease VapC